MTNFRIKKVNNEISNDEIEEYQNFAEILSNYQHHSIRVKKKYRILSYFTLFCFSILSVFLVVMKINNNSDKSKLSHNTPLINDTLKSFSTTSKPIDIKESLNSYKPNSITLETLDNSLTYNNTKSTKTDTINQPKKNREDSTDLKLDLESRYENAYPKEGFDKLYQYFQTNLKYPSEAVKYKIKGTVIVFFRVTPQASIENIKIVKSLGYGCDEEAIKLIKNMPKWIPAKRNGFPVSKYIKIPIVFNML